MYEVTTTNECAPGLGRPAALVMLLSLLGSGVASADRFDSPEGKENERSVALDGDSPPSGVAAGEDPVSEAEGRPRRELRALRVSSPPVIDGRLDEHDWRMAPVATDFVQSSPNEGEPSSERTEARVLYDDQAVYVGIRAFDSSPEQIVARVGRHDNLGNSDSVAVMFDSYHDRRTAFVFAVNPAGVKLDAYRFADTSSDLTWDAVWDVATTIDEHGWTAELRIPLSQLRVPHQESQAWGLNFERWIARIGERSNWAPIGPSTPGPNSSFFRDHGVVQGADTLDLHLHHVTGRQRTDSAWSAGGDDVSRLEGEVAADEAD